MNFYQRGEHFNTNNDFINMGIRGKFITFYMPVVQYKCSLAPLVVDNSQQGLDSCQRLLGRLALDRLGLVLDMVNQDKPILHGLMAAT